MWLSQLFEFGILLTHLIIGLIFLYALLHRQQAREIIEKIKGFGDRIALIIATGGVVGSFLYSYVVRYEACVLCYAQRYLLMGVAILLSLAIALKNKTLHWCVMVVGIVGTLVAGYHALLQWFPTLSESSICNSLGGISCGLRHVYAFGYITIPVMSLTVFVIVLFFLGLKLRK